jgi:hypothetical protein
MVDKIDVIIMQSGNKIPRWVIENDPSWQRSTDSDSGMLRWTKKNAPTQATCHPDSMFCEMVEPQDLRREFSNLAMRTTMDRYNKPIGGIDEITKYLSSSYLNPGMNGPRRFDTRKFYNH